MDYSGPPDGNLERLFDQYDAIRSEFEDDRAEDAMDDMDDTPPWQVPPPPPPPPTTTQTPPTTTQVPPTNQDELMRLGYKRKNWNDVRADKMVKAQKLLDERLHEAQGAKALQDKFKNPNGASLAQDEEGMNQAYADTGFPGIAYDPNTRTEYIKGSTTAQDWADDFKIPFGNTVDSERYEQADRAYEYLTRRGLAVDRVVGHSLGGSVALEMQIQKGIPLSRTFGAPVFDLKPSHRGSVERYRHPLDPVSIFDRAATWGDLKAFPHTYKGFGSLSA